MKKLIYLFDSKINLIVILFLFWALFWTLNGGDKFFNGKFVSNTAGWSTKGVLVDQTGETIYTLHPMEFEGWFGVNRDNKMINYFGNLFLPKEIALISLYGVAILEVILGIVFFSLFFWSLLSKEKQEKWEIYANRTVHRLAFKGSIIIFLIFSTGDILFGDRTELWEHGTFIILSLITYDMWYRTDRFFLAQGQENSYDSYNQASLDE